MSAAIDFYAGTGFNDEWRERRLRLRVLPALSQRADTEASAEAQTAELPGLWGQAPVRLGAPATQGQVHVQAQCALRLTARGRIAVASLVLAVAALLLGVAALSRPSAAGTPALRGTVTVQAGDTLWSIAGSAAPGRDPRDVVHTLRTINHLGSVELVPGQQLKLG